MVTPENLEQYAGKPVFTQDTIYSRYVQHSTAPVSAQLSSLCIVQTNTDITAVTRTR